MAVLYKTKRRRARNAGQSLVEALAGAVVLIPLLLLCVDAVVVMNVNHTNQELAQTAARAAANIPDEDSAKETAQKAVDNFPESSLVSSATMSAFTYDSAQKLVTVSVTMTVTIPIPLPGASSVTLTATSVQPIVALPPSV